MVTAIVRFTLPPRIGRAEAVELFKGSAPRYRTLPGLIRKYYVLAEDGRTAGGVYLWKSREAAEQTYSAEWRAMIAQRYGAEPSVTYFETPVVVDNVLGEIVSEA